MTDFIIWPLLCGLTFISICFFLRWPRPKTGVYEPKEVGGMALPWSEEDRRFSDGFVKAFTEEVKVYDPSKDPERILRGEDEGYFE